MKLYYATGACSLADRICLIEAGIAAEYERVDLKTKLTEKGIDFRSVSPKGYVPALVLDDGEVLTENVAILCWIADRAPDLTPAGPLGSIRLVEALAYIATELHKDFKPFFHRSSDAEKSAAADAVTRRLRYLEKTFRGEYLLGARFTAADAYLFVMLTWARRFGVQIPQGLTGYSERLMHRESIRRALAAEDADRTLVTA